MGRIKYLSTHDLFTSDHKVLIVGCLNGTQKTEKNRRHGLDLGTGRWGSPMLRTLHAEILDTLPADSGDAIASRRDLILINRMMRNQRWMDQALHTHAGRSDRVLELGAGAGDFGCWLRANRDGPCPKMCGLDLAPRPLGWPDEWSWEQYDLVSFPGYSNFDVVIANLTLHHFDADALATLGQQLRSGPRIVLACEPARKLLHLWQSQLLRFCGVNYVTRHDAPVSVRAGFRQFELPQLLGLSAPKWRASVAETWRGAYRMIAVKDVRA